MKSNNFHMTKITGSCKTIE